METETNSFSGQRQAHIVSQHVDSVSPWVSIVGKEVDFADGRQREVYHCIDQADYVSILARTPDGRIPLVRQFRPAVEEYTWELPAGLLEEDESPESCCRRELIEEVGVHPQTVEFLGTFFPDTGRLANRLHVFYVEASKPDPALHPERGIEIKFVEPIELKQMILEGHFRHQLHIGVLTLAAIRGIWNWNADILSHTPHQ